MHLQIAERILESARLEPQLRELVRGHLPAFYLGNVAPDYQTITDTPRENTHFYHLPPDPGDDACRTMFTRYPALVDASSLRPEHAIFVTAYCSHLLLDLLWYREILIPDFLGPGDWQDHRHRFIVHNTLLTYLDKKAFDVLPQDAASTLEAAVPDEWLPFASNGELSAWRDLLVSQLMPGATMHTVEIYAGRLSMSPEEFSDNLDRQEWMEEHVFTRVNIDSVLSLLIRAVGESVDLIKDYLKVIL